MTAPVTARLAPPRGRPSGRPVERPRPPLKVVPEGYRSPKAQRRRARLVATAGVTVACGVAFGLAAVHVLLAEGQFRLAHLQHQADDAQAQYVRLRLDVAQLESPERVVAVAQEKLGMVVPTALTYLTPSGSVAVSAGVTRSPSTTGRTPTTASSPRHPPDTTKGWAAAKPALASHP